MYNLGTHYFMGKGAEQDFGEAVRLFEGAADRGFPQAMFNLATMLGEGRGVPQDVERSLEWYARAAEHGVKEAEMILGDPDSADNPPS